MKRYLPLLLIVLGNGLCAQSRELWVSVGGSVLFNTKLGTPAPDGDSNDTRLGAGYRFGIRFGVDSTRRIGHEFQYGYSRARFTDDTGAILGDPGSGLMAIHQGGYNFLYYLTGMEQEAKVRLFVTGGFHISDFPLPGVGAVQASSIKPGLNYGGGVKWRLSPLFGARLDLREYETGKPNWNNLLSQQSGLLHQAEISAGIGIVF
jgi:hypothetical protein